MYRHNILGLSLNEIENQLKSYPTQDAEDLLKRLRNELATDTINREPENEDDISVMEAQAQGGKEEYRDHFNKMLKDFGVSNISELPADKRKTFFMKIDKHWKADNESKKKVNEELGSAEDIFSDFVEMFAEHSEVLILIANEMKKMDSEIIEEKSGTKRTTMTRVTRQTKIDRAIGALSVQYAKAVNDPMYKKFKKYKDKWMKFKERIQMKYKARVRTAARTGGGIAHLLKDKQKGGAQTGKTAKKKK